VKGHAVLLEALVGLDATLDVVGGGPLEAELRERAAALGVAERVTFHGALGHDEVERLYAQADVFCLPSFAEGLPVVLLEAMAHGIPVVATRITGVPEAVTDGVEGLLVSPARPDELAAALVRIAADPDLAARMGEAGARRIASELSHEASISQIEQALRRVVP
jgi:glycosyltransferase involved in cell wall biosynthesis